MDEAHALLELQDRDLRIMRLAKQLDEMPEKRAILAARSKIADIRRLEQRTDGAVRAAESEVKRLEDEVSQVADKMEAEQAKLVSGEVTNPKELQNISRELDGLRKRKEQLEQAELDGMSRRETAVEQSAKVTAAIEAGEAREAELTKEFQEKGGALISDMEALRSERAALAAGLAAEVLAHYDALRESKSGLAAARLEGDMCGVCRVTVPAAELDTLREGPTVASCPNCGRILVVTTEVE